MKRIWPFFVALLLFLLPAPAADSAGTRARALDSELRCMTCQGETIAESQADLAADMRAEVRRRIAAGESDAQIKAYFVSRYGDYILMRPPVQGNTLLLWLAPGLILLIAAGGAFFWFRRTPGKEPRT